MPRVRRRSRSRLGYTDADILVLLTGHDFFSDSTIGDDEAARLEAWNDPEVRQRVYDLHARRNARGNYRERPWAAERFGSVE
jgi:hypothetical protein